MDIIKQTKLKEIQKELDEFLKIPESKKNEEIKEKFLKNILRRVEEMAAKPKKMEIGFFANDFESNIEDLKNSITSAIMKKKEKDYTESFVRLEKLLEELNKKEIKEPLKVREISPVQYPKEIKVANQIKLPRWLEGFESNKIFEWFKKIYKGIKELRENILNVLVRNDYENPIPVILTDLSGKPYQAGYYWASVAGSGGGGGGTTQYTDGTPVNASQVGVISMGSDGSNLQFIATDSSGHLQVDVLSGGGGGTLKKDGETIVADDTASIVAGMDDSSKAQFIHTDSSGNLQVNILNTPLAVTQAGTWNINNISGTISLPTGAATEATLASIDGKVTACNTGAVTISTALPAGTNIIGAVKRDTINYTPVNKYYSYEGAVTDGIVWSPSAGKKWVITDITLTTSAAATVTLEEDKVAGDEVVMAWDLAANGGVSLNLQTPRVASEADADLIVTTTAGNLKLFVSGYEIE